MKRPIGVTIIACFCLCAAVYLCSLSVMQLVTPKALHAIRSAPNVRALRLASPYLTLIIGVSWAVVGWGLFQLRNWARVIAATMFVFSAIWETSMTWEASMSAHRSWPNWRLTLISLEIALRVIALVYLCLVGGRFQDQMSGQSSLSAAPQ
jgi:hypothetical protein